MVLTAVFLLSTTLGPVPQGLDDPRLETALPDSKVERLRHLAARWQERKEPAIRAELIEGLERRYRGAPVIHRVGDLVRVFEGTASSPPLRTGVRREGMGPAGRGYLLSVPESYSPDRPHRTVLVIPDRGGRPEKYVGSRTTFDSGWKGSGMADTVVAVTEPPAPFDRRPEEQVETSRLEATPSARFILDNLRDLQRRCHVDPRRIILDCGVQSSTFGIRLAALRPDRFAALILREPSAFLDEYPASALRNVRFLLIAPGHGRTPAHDLQRKLERLHPGSTTLVDARAAGAGLQARIDAWAEQVRRPWFPPEVRIAAGPRFVTASDWIEVQGTIRGVEQPFVRASADRALNRITIETKGIAALSLLLNHALVDPDHLVVSVNGKVVDAVHGHPGAGGMLDRILRSDPTRLYTRIVEVPIPEWALSAGDGAIARGSPAVSRAPTAADPQPAPRRSDRLSIDMKWTPGDPRTDGGDHPVRRSRAGRAEGWPEPTATESSRTFTAELEPQIEDGLQLPPGSGSGWWQRLTSIEFVLAALALVAFAVVQVLLRRSRRARLARQPRRVATRPDPRASVAPDR